jgi:PHD/YefM family antitoxin component YafN of YafNO toxin-antitoxin module
MREAERRGLVAVTEAGRVAAFLVSRERIMAMIESLEILSDPQAMKAVREFESGKTRMRPVSTLDEN